MKKGTLINSEISYLISKMGHTDSLTIGDAGLPIPKGVERIDMAVSQGIPSFMNVFEAVTSEQKVEKVILAEEIKTNNPKIYNEILMHIKKLEKKDGGLITIEYINHEAFKMQTQNCACIIRTGEFSPYANVILVSGVVF